MKNLNNKNGVTLIALVVTIIVLIILAGVSISLVVGNNGIITKAKEAKENFIKSTEEEQTKLNELYAEMLGKLDNNQDDKDEEEDEIGLTDEEKTALANNGIAEILEADITNDNLKNKDKVKAVITGNVPIPVESKYIEGTVDTGVVIEYKESEFVWVPIPVTDNNDLYAKGTTKPMARLTSGRDENGRLNYQGVLYTFPYSQDNTTSQEKTNYGQGSQMYREPAFLSDTYYGAASNENAAGITEDGLQKEYNEMIESVSKYGGFFIGRYETSINTETSKAQSIADVTPTNAYSSGTKKWYGLYLKQKEFTTDSDKMVSNMVWGSQYDALLNWALEEEDKFHVNTSSNATHRNSYSVTSIKTRTTTENDRLTGLDRINNIYDLEGNLCEWTMESMYTYQRIARGGAFIDGYSAQRKYL